MSSARNINANASSDSIVRKPIPLVRTVIAGFLMGLANLIPGVSGGTMVLVMGVYQEFVGAIADITSLRWTKRSLVVVTLFAISGGVAIVGLSGVIHGLVSSHRVLMYALFAGMTLGGAPVLMRMVGRPNGPSVLAWTIGVASVTSLAFVHTPEKPDKAALEASGVKLTEADIDYGRDVVAGVAGMSAMVLPGISGSQMLLILGRYESILLAVSEFKDYVLSRGRDGSLLPVRVLAPVAIGSLVSLVLLSNMLKWLLSRYERTLAGFLLGVLLGSAILLGLMVREENLTERAVPALGMLALGFASTVVIFLATERATSQKD